MSLSRITAFALDGVESRRVWVEADIRIGLPAFTIVGLADKAVREARERVRSAITNSGFEFPQKRITINLAPAYLRKIGPGFDLPLAMAILAASGQVEAEAVANCALAGELSLTGDAAPDARRARGRAGRRRARDRPGDGAGVAGSRGRARRGGRGDRRRRPARRRRHPGRAPRGPAAAASWSSTPRPPWRFDPPDLADVRGHDALLPAIVVAAAGGHNLFLHGPPGTGKTMLARRIPSILPPLSRAEAIEVTRIHSIAGLHTGGALVEARPFRAPHHTISPSGLVGGGAQPAPGEVTLAHHGVLVPRRALGVRALGARGAAPAARGRPDRDRALPARDDCSRPAACSSRPRTRARAGSATTAAAAPPPTSPATSAASAARCSTASTSPSRSGARRAQALRDQRAPASAVLREQVVAARERQSRRFAGLGVACNAQMTPRMVRELVGATPSALRLLYELHDRDGLSARGHHRVLRVARTAADLEGSDVVGPEHVAAALAHRTDAAPHPAAA